MTTYNFRGALDDDVTPLAAVYPASQMFGVINRTKTTFLSVYYLRADSVPIFYWGGLSR